MHRSEGIALQQRLTSAVSGLLGATAAGQDRAAGFERFTEETRAIFGARRATLWLHERRARELRRAAVAGSPADASPSRISTGAPQAAARALRAGQPELHEEDRPGASAPFITIPLRGRRRALGTLVVEGIDPTTQAEGLLDLAGVLGHQLASAIENAQLFDDVLQARRELEDTFNSLIDLVIVFDQELRIVRTNQALALRLGVGARELADRSLSEILSPEHLDWIARLDLRAAGSAGPAATLELDETKLGGRFVVTVTPWRRPDGTLSGGVLVARDVTEQARLAAERAALQERLSQSEKLAALGQFVAGTAHELNNPLQAVLGNLELLQMGKKLPPEIGRELRGIYREADRAATIVRNLLVFAGRRKPPARRLSLNSVVARALALRMPALKKAGVTVARRFDERMPKISGDRLLLQQAFLNILLNAEQAMSGSGARHLAVETSTAAAGGVAVVEVRDSGPGIPDEIMPRIFEPFYTTKEVGQGTGLGLAITHGIIRDHGGTIRAANAEGGGARFRVELPLAQTDGLPTKKKVIN